MINLLGLVDITGSFLNLGERRSVPVPSVSPVAMLIFTFFLFFFGLPRARLGTATCSVSVDRVSAGAGGVAPAFPLDPPRLRLTT